MTEICLKVLLIGDSSVGKTALLLKYVDGLFSENHIASIGVEYKDKIIVIDNKKIKLEIWDTAGQEIYRSLTKNFYRQADAFLFVFDVTNELSYEHIKDWFLEVEEIGKDLKKILVANKIDLNNKRIIDKERMEKFAEKNNMKCFETSAKEGTNVDIIFTEIAKLIIQNKSEKDIIEEFGNRPTESSTMSLESKKTITHNKKKCC